MGSFHAFQDSKLKLAADKIDPKLSAHGSFFAALAILAADPAKNLKTACQFDKLTDYNDYHRAQKDIPSLLANFRALRSAKFDESARAYEENFKTKALLHLGELLPRMQMVASAGEEFELLKKEFNEALLDFFAAAPTGKTYTLSNGKAHPAREYLAHRIVNGASTELGNHICASSYKGAPERLRMSLGKLAAVCSLSPAFAKLAAQKASKKWIMRNMSSADFADEGALLDFYGKALAKGADISDIFHWVEPEEGQNFSEALKAEFKHCKACGIKDFFNAQIEQRDLRRGFGQDDPIFANRFEDAKLNRLFELIRSLDPESSAAIDKALGIIEPHALEAKEQAEAKARACLPRPAPKKPRSGSI